MGITAAGARAYAVTVQDAYAWETGAPGRTPNDSWMLGSATLTRDVQDRHERAEHDHRTDAHHGRIEPCRQRRSHAPFTVRAGPGRSDPRHSWTDEPFIAEQPTEDRSGELQTACQGPVPALRRGRLADMSPQCGLLRRQMRPHINAVGDQPGRGVGERQGGLQDAWSAGRAGRFGSHSMGPPVVPVAVPATLVVGDEGIGTFLT